MILVTGGSGMLGSALKPHLPDAMYISRKDADLRDRSETRALFEKVRPTAVIHLAARVGGVKDNAEHNDEYLRDNVLINTNVLASAIEFGASRFVSLLSSCCFAFEDEIATEEDLHRGLPFAGNLGYGCAKRLLDIHCRLAPISCMTITPATMFGPHDNFDLEDGHVVGALIHRCLDEGDLAVWGDGTAIRQFVYVNDIAKIIAGLIASDERGNRIIAADDGITIRELAETVAEACDFRGRILFDASKPTGLKRKVMRSSRPFAWSFTPLKDALKETAAWYKEHQ